MATESPADQRAGSLGEQCAAISNALVRLHRDYLGRGPTKARTSIRDDTVVVVLQDTMTKAEHSLVASGQSEDVLRTRHLFQRAMREDIMTAVEQVTGRDAIAFMSDNHLDPDLAVEIVVLEASPQAVTQ